MQPFSAAIPGAAGASLRKKRPYKKAKTSKGSAPKNRREKKKQQRQNVQSHPVKTSQNVQSHPVKTSQKPNQIKKTESKELKRHLYIFKSLTRKAKNRDIVLKKAPLSLYKTIRLLFKLLKKGAIPLNNGQRNRLKPWINFIRENSTGNDSTVKSRVSQSGDGLSSILKTVLPIIAPILSMIV